jgi:GNAT superfamily N-acetyltransferase
MGEFFVWLEERTYSGLIASGVKPYIQEDWRVSSRKRLVLRYRWPGYEAPEWKTMGERDEFGSLWLMEDEDGYYSSETFDVDPPFHRRGYGSDLMKRGLELVKSSGGLGIRSYKSGRTLSASSFWNARATRSDEDSDYLEWIFAK